MSEESKTHQINLAVEDAEDARVAAQQAEHAAEDAEKAAEAAAEDAREALEKFEAAEVAAEKKQASIELFELCTAILLGLGAIFSGIASHQGGLWEGDSVEAFTEASTITTQAADAASLANAMITHDNNVHLQAMQIVSQAQLMPADSQDRAFLLHQASALYLRQASDAAYSALGLPEDCRKQYKQTSIEDIPEDELILVQRREFAPEYYREMYGQSDKKYKEAKVKFDRGTLPEGDYFSLCGVYYSLSLFFAGLGLVFKTRMRWVFFSIGTLIFMGTTTYLCSLNWL
jgi:hypothetical protein